MLYAKLKPGNALSVFAAPYLIHEGILYTDPPDRVLRAEGYKPVVRQDPEPDGGIYTVDYEELPDRIVGHMRKVVSE